MFGFADFARQARKWRANRDRRQLQSMLSGLPVELRKDIGWPAPDARSAATRVVHRDPDDLHARPIV